MLTGIPGLLNGLLAYLDKKQDTSAVFDGNSKDVAVALIQAEVAKNAAVKDVTSAMLSHPTFWVAWGVGVFPVLFYHAAIYFVSTFPACGWTVLKVPDVELEYGRLVVGAVFTLTGASTVVSGIAHAWKRRA
jgi:hypothetical protein